ncbi:glycosyl hydrolase [marine bacterium AO1-C]|nr:glycosyl hydrolase [marine bacterium AO1-C]
MNKINYPILLSFLVLLGFCLPTQAQRKANKSKKPKVKNSFSRDFQAMRWRNIGPFRGGRSVTATGVRQYPHMYYMGSTGGGVWKTEDAGITWKNISDKYFKTGSVGAIAVSESDPNVVYVGMGEHAVRGVMTSAGDGVYKSEDGGRTWKHLGLAKTRHISAIRIHPDNPEVVYVAAQGAVHGATQERGIYKSVDGGKTWKKTLFVNDLTGASDLSMDMRNPRILYAAMWEHIRYPWQVKSGGKGSGLYKSTDGGETWKPLKAGLPKMMGKTSVDVSRANPNRVYANIEAKKGGVFRSDNGGLTWRRINGDRVTQARSWYYMEVFADPKNEDVVYVLNAPVLKSVDGGKTFKPVRVPHGDNHDLWINPDNNQIMINANDGGANISFNGGKSWSAQDNQPTSQFYRVTTDDRFPYYVYGGQQDNSSVAIASRTNGRGITWKDWYAVAGCESAYLAFDPKDPRYILGGCYQGLIFVYDHETKEQKNVMAHPFLGLGSIPKDVKYRYNWNAPIIASLHDPKTIYHAGNVLFKTTNYGQSWQVISADLTRNEKNKQGKGGGPITNEAAGGEVYGTIMYVAESKHEKGTLWVGSDDGLLHLTKDEGKTWNNVTPKGLGEAMINSIEVSPHDKATAYVVATRYKFNDFAPMIYKTTDYGKSWKKITNGIAAESFARVVREDQVRKDLLYAGTETGLYVSMDGGNQWKRLRLNLPIVPINDLTIRNNDLVAATAGRAFWILDDLSPLQQFKKADAQKPMMAYTPRNSYKMNGASIPASRSGVGQNPPNGVIMYYALSKKLDSIQSLVLEILDSQNKVIRTLSSKKPKKSARYFGAPAPKRPLAVRLGLNRVVWNMAREGLPAVPKVFIFGGTAASRVAPGNYKARFKLMTEDKITAEQTVSFEILADPRLKASSADFAQQQRLILELESNVRDINNKLKQIRSARQQIKQMSAVMKNRKEAKALVDSAKATMKKIKQWERGLIQPDQKTFQDVINFPNKLVSEMMFIRNNMDSHDPRITEGAKQRMKEVIGMWQKHKQGFDQLLKNDIAQINKMYNSLNMNRIVIPKLETQD